MKILFTDEHPIMEHFEGHEIIRGDHVFRSSHVDMDDPDPSDYPLKKILRNENPDVVFLVDLFKAFRGKRVFFHRSAVLSWSSSSYQKVVVAIGNDEPGMFNQNLQKSRSCIGKIDHCNLYVCNTEELATRASKFYRTALFDGSNINPVIDGINAAIRSPSILGDRNSPYI